MLSAAPWLDSAFPKYKSPWLETTSIVLSFVMPICILPIVNSENAPLSLQTGSLPFASTTRNCPAEPMESLLKVSRSSSSSPLAVLPLPANRISPLV